MSMWRKQCLRYLLLCLLMHQSVSARQYDVALRAAGEIEKELSKKWTAGLEYEHRWHQNLTKFDKAILEPSVSYDIVRDFRFAFSYRLAYNQTTRRRNERIQQRFSTHLQYRFRFDDARVRFRTRLQYGADDMEYLDFTSHNMLHQENELVNRNSIQADYRFRGTPFRPFATYEFFYHINNKVGAVVNQQRFRLGTRYKHSGSFSWDLYYMFRYEMNVVIPVSSHVLGIGFSYTL